MPPYSAEGSNRSFSYSSLCASLYVALSLSLRLGGELDEVQAELLRRVVESVLVDRLDALGREPQPHPSVSLLPKQAPLLEVKVLHLEPPREKKNIRKKKKKREKKERATR